MGGRVGALLTAECAHHGSQQSCIAPGAAAVAALVLAGLCCTGGRLGYCIHCLLEVTSAIVFTALHQREALGRLALSLAQVLLNALHCSDSEMH